MAQSTLFSDGIELAAFVTSSGLLRRSWDFNVISSSHEDIDSNNGEGLSWKVYKELDTDVMIIAFEATPPADSSSNHQANLVSSSELREERNFLHFEFLSSKKNPLFSLNSTAVSLFYKNHLKLDELKSKVKSFPQLIITGLALGGSIASLFTLSLLDSIDSGKNRPLCITFGSPLVGDKKLQQAISRSSKWNSCFLHVVSLNDPLPRLFIANPTSASYMPFGTFLLCSDANSTCFENPDSTLEILVALDSIHGQNQGFQHADYGNIVKNLNLKAIHKDFTAQAENMTHADSLLAISISLQLQALGLTQHMQQQHMNIDITILENMKTLEKGFIEQRRKSLDLVSFSELNKRKVNMAQIEWYKKDTKNQGIGYYDSYKKKMAPLYHDARVFYKELTTYWTGMVEEAEMQPQKEGANFRKTRFYAGTNYRRMIEPLAIAQYYGEGGKNYVHEKRSKHFEQLEEWLKEGTAKGTSDSNSTSKEKVEAILTIDSCFWAHVEEALLLCRELKAAKEKEEALKKLLEFEEYVYGLLKNYAVSPEIFLPQSSYMHWWNEYKAIKGSSYTSALANFMKDARKLEQYAMGACDFP